MTTLRPDRARIGAGAKWFNGTGVLRACPSSDFDGDDHYAVFSNN
jgi:hypothetical protein